jgi:hypothetical protein
MDALATATTVVMIRATFANMTAPFFNGANVAGALCCAHKVFNRI